MLEKTLGIAIKNIHYKESSSIVSVYTESFGLKSYIIKGGRKRNATVHSSLFQPLQVLDLVVYENPKNSLQSIKECSLALEQNSIYTNIIKTSLAYFLQEVICLSLKENASDKDIFNFLHSSVIKLNTCEDKSLKDFHLHFLYDFATLLGFKPYDISLISENKQERLDKLSLLINFYQENITDNRPILSHQILHTIL
ncbi:MAG: DNA repair protein RecO [Bacteroidales bacterium]|nr:DNA repair protein RecO [Bacteroidales bacterium]